MAEEEEDALAKARRNEDKARTAKDERTRLQQALENASMARGGQAEAPPDR